MKPKVSIIVPIYNVEEYLNRSIQSLINQTLQEIEIIAVNDGSNDKSGQIIKDFAKNDSRIKIIEQQNSGVSSARNVGVEIAQGEYIGFIDPDDWVDERMYEVLYNKAINHHTDVVMCSYIREFGTHSKIKEFNVPNETSYLDEEVQNKMMRRLVGPIHEEVSNPEMLDSWGTVWSKLYKADLIKTNHLKFVDLKEIGTNEDTLFNIELFYYAKSFIFLNTPFYHYWKVNNGSETEGKYKPQLMNKWFKLYSIIETFLKVNEMSEEFFLALNNRICMNLLGAGLNIISKGNSTSYFKKLNKIKEILNDQRIKQSFKEMDFRFFPIKWRLFYWFAKFEFSIGFLLMLISIEMLRKQLR